MTHRVLRTVLLGLVIISLLLLGACANGPGGAGPTKPPAEPDGPDGAGEQASNPAQPLYWADVLEKHHVSKAQRRPVDCCLDFFAK